MRETSVVFLAESCGGRIIGNKAAVITNVVIDSREAGKGSLFVCITGERNDGHDFAEDAYELGCRIFLMSDEEAAERVSALDSSNSVILAEDSSEAFKDMAAAYIGQFNLIRIAVTGSAGKTTTRRLIAAALSKKYRTVSGRKNYNTHLGLCVSCFDADESTEAAIFEMGMDRRGEIKGYCSWIVPDAAVISNIGLSHMEALGSKSAIFDAKLEILSFLKPGSPLFYIPDGEFLTENEIVKRSGRSDIDLCPVLEGGDIELLSYSPEGIDGSSFTLSVKGRPVRMKLPLLGEHNVRNAALAAAVAGYYGVEAENIAGAFSELAPADGRLKPFYAGDITVIDDSYNASPSSMIAGLDVLAGIPAKRHIAVISDMLELGSAGPEAHREIGRYAAKLGTDLILIAGQHAELYMDGIREAGAEDRAHVFSSVSQLCDGLKGCLESGDSVLVKGSNSTGISAAAERIVKEFSQV